MVLFGCGKAPDSGAPSTDNGAPKTDGTAPAANSGITASQSSVYLDAGAEKALDGNTDGVVGNGSVTHTNQEKNAWWQVDLGKSAEVTSIEIFNRTDCCSDRLSDFWVFVSDTPFAPGDAPSMLKGRAETWNSHQTRQPNPSTSIPVNSKGRYIRVQLDGENYLSLAEVKISKKP
jgi:hypothetical protein